MVVRFCCGGCGRDMRVQKVTKPLDAYRCTRCLSVNNLPDENDGRPDTDEFEPLEPDYQSESWFEKHGDGSGAACFDGP